MPFLHIIKTKDIPKCDSGFRNGKLGAIESDQSCENSQRNVKNNKHSNESLIVLTCWSRFSKGSQANLAPLF